MANPYSIDHLPAVIVTSTAQDELFLDERREYTISHDGETNAGAADANTIYIAIRTASDEDDVVATSAEGTNKIKLRDGRSVVVGPSVRAIRHKTAAGAPTFTIIANPDDIGVRR